jgi:NADH dehydrogenase FAD-containing subunit
MQHNSARWFASKYISCTLQVKGYSHIFAVGDCIWVDDTQLSYLGVQHAQDASKNIVALANGNTTLKAWKKNGGTKLNLLTLGKKNVCLLLGNRSPIPAPAFLTWGKCDATRKKLGIK